MLFSNFTPIVFLACFLSSGFSVAGKHHGEKNRFAAEERYHFLIHTISSRDQKGETKIRVLLPERFSSKKKYRVLFVLPVEAGEGKVYGDGLLEIRKTGLHNKHQLICVAPTFSDLPWYADHPTDRTIQQESYFLKVVLPFVDRTYPTTQSGAGRFLLGFSKSGWGAYSLILRHPHQFEKAAAWDAPLMKQKPDQFGMRPIFGSQQNFDQYKVSSLLEKKAASFRDRTRLVLAGYGNFREHHVRFHQLAVAHGLACTYRDGPYRKHHWNSGWVGEALDLLMQP